MFIKLIFFFAFCNKQVVIEKKPPLATINHSSPLDSWKKKKLYFFIFGDRERIFKTEKEIGSGWSEEELLYQVLTNTLLIQNWYFLSSLSQ